MMMKLTSNVIRYTELLVGSPPQKLEVDIDMLSPDFYTVMTTSGKGSRYDTFASTSHGIKRQRDISSLIDNLTVFTAGHSDERVHPLCPLPSDDFLFSGLDPIRLACPICTPSKASRQTLANSGTLLGLSPHGSLARLSSQSLLSQLLDKNVISHNIWSATLLDADTGILSFGGTIAKEVEEAKIRGEVELQHFGESVATPEWVAEQVAGQMRLVMPAELPWDHHFKWTDVQGAAGWWTALMRGVWISEAKVSKIDVPSAVCTERIVIQCLSAASPATD